MSDFTSKTLTEARGLLAAGEITVEQAVTAALERIKRTEPKVSALLSVRDEAALDKARALDKAGYDPGQPLWGVPIVVKDVLTTKGARCTCGSRILENFVPFYDATAVERLEAAGAVVVGKANMDEFAMGSSTENSAYFPTHNPWDLDRVPGGSSGGSAASVAADQCFAALGTDTGGSIRLPACFCGVVGLKPSYGRVSRYGLVAFGSSLDCIGPLTRSVEDAARVLQVIAGHDKRDSTSVDAPVPDYLAALEGRTDFKGLTIGLPREYWEGEGLSDEVRTACQAAVDRAVDLGAETVPVTLSMTDYAIATYYIVAMAEASSNLARFDGVRYGLRDKSAEELVDMYVRTRTAGFGDEVQRRIIIGTYVLSAGYYDAYYRKAAQVRRLLRRDFETAFQSCDFIAGPVCPTTAFKVGEKADPLQMYLMDIFTISASLSGLPGLSLPVGLGADTSMPVGLQLIGPSFGEDVVLSAGHALERALDPLPKPSGLG